VSTLRAGWRAAVLAGVVALIPCRSALAVVEVLDASTRVVETDSNTSGLNNSVPLVNSPGGSTLSASGNASFGSLPGENYNSAAVSNHDALGKRQFAPLPMNGPGVFLYGTNFDCALLTDNIGDNVGNTGVCTITQSDGSGVIASGDIYAGSTTSAQTGVAQIGTVNAAIFNTPAVPQQFNVFVNGSAFYGPNATDQYGSVVVQYRDPSNGITYDSLPIGESRDYFGFRFRVFITDRAGQLGDNSGQLFVNFNPSSSVPEPGIVGVVLIGAMGLGRRRR
jgi:hypothetical protein